MLADRGSLVAVERGHVNRRNAIATAGALVFCGAGVSAAGPHRFQMRFNLSMTNPSGIDLGRQDAWLYLPAGPTAHFALAGIETPVAHTLERDGLSHNVLHVSVERLPAYSRQLFPMYLTLEPSTAVVPAADPAPWLAPQRFMESDEPEIVALAHRLGGGSSEQTVARIYDYVAQNMKYAGYLAEDFGALYAARHLSGDCTEYACLVVALCRANGIPARMVGGYVGATSQAPKPMDYHNWAEVLLDGRWRVSDAQKRNFLSYESDYIAFRYFSQQAGNGVGLAHRYRVLGSMEFSM